MMTKEGSTKVVNFLIPCARVLVLRCGLINAFSSPLPVYTGVWIRQMKYRVMMTKEGSPKIVNYMTPGAGVLVLGHGHVVKMQCFFSSFCIHWGMDQTNQA